MPDDASDAPSSGRKGRASTALAVDALAAEIVAGDIAADTVLRVEGLTQRLKITRSMAHEVLLALREKGLVRLQPRIGATVQAMGEWAVLDPMVIDWRLRHAGHGQMTSLTQLREAIEPKAAGLAATRTSPGLGRELILLAKELKSIADDNRGFDRVRFKDADFRFHAMVLGASGNELFGSLTYAVKKALDHRIDTCLADSARAGFAAVADTKPFPERPEPIARWLHIGMAVAIAQGRSAAAAAFTRALLVESRGELGNDEVTSEVYAGLQTIELTADDREEFLDKLAAAVPDRAPVVPVVLMGVSGAGKTAIGNLLAGRLGRPFVEGDTFHPQRNREQMERGRALTDEDREPWLRALADQIKNSGDAGVVMACSALKRRYRDILREGDPRTWFLHLHIDQQLAHQRVKRRTAHFMPATLVPSQFEALEPLQNDEDGSRVDASATPKRIVTAAVNLLGAL